MNFPDTCNIPKSVLNCNSLSSEEKIYFGVLCSCKDENGYCLATTDQIAEVFRVDEKWVVDWNTSLEKNGFIKMEKGYPKILKICEKNDRPYIRM